MYSPKLRSESDSEGISDALRIRLSSAMGRQLARRYTRNLEAYTLYLQAHARLNTRTHDGFLQSRRLFERALSVQQDYAPALAGLATALILLAEYEVVVGSDAFPKAREAALGAIRLDPEMAEAHTALGWIRGWFEWDRAGAEMEFKRAIALHSGWSTGHQWWGEYLSVVGRHEEALTELRRALELDPISPLLNALLALALFFARRYEESLRQCERTLEIDDGFLLASYVLSFVLHQLKLFDRAIEAVDRTQQLWGTPGHHIERALILAAAGRRSEALDVLEGLKQGSHAAHGYRWLNLALIHAGLGNMDVAFAQLEEAYRERAYALLDLNVDPRFDRLRADPRFDELLRRIGCRVS